MKACSPLTVAVGPLPDPFPAVAIPWVEPPAHAGAVAPGSASPMMVVECRMGEWYRNGRHLLITAEVTRR